MLTYITLDEQVSLQKNGPTHALPSEERPEASEHFTHKANLRRLELRPKHAVSGVTALLLGHEMNLHSVKWLGNQSF